MGLLSLTPLKGEQFDPASLPWNFLFYKDHTASGSTLTQWTDSMGSYNATPVNSPTINATDSEINNRFSVNFNGTSQYCNFAGSTNLWNPSNAWTFVALVKPSNVTSFRYMCGLKGSTVGAHFAVTNSVSYQHWYIGSNGQTCVRANTTAVSTSAWTLLTVVFTGGGTLSGNVSLFRNNATDTATSGGLNSNDNVASRIGAQINTIVGSFFAGKIAFLAGGNFAMTADERNELDAWIQSYYGV